MDEVQSPASRFNFIFAGSSSTTEAADNFDAAHVPDVVPIVDTFTPPAYSLGLNFHLGSRDQGTGSKRGTGRPHEGVGVNYRTAALHRRLGPANGLKRTSMVTQQGRILATSPSAAAPRQFAPQPQVLTDAGQDMYTATAPLELCGPTNLGGPAGTGGAETKGGTAVGSRPLDHVDRTSESTAEDSSGNALDTLISLLLLPDGDDPQGLDISSANAEPLWPSVSFPGAAMNNSLEGNKACATSVVGSDAVANGNVEGSNALDRDRMSAGTHTDRELPSSVGTAWGRQICGQPASSADGDGMGERFVPADPRRGRGGHSAGASSGKEDGGMLGLHALAAALDEVEASLDLPGATTPGALFPQSLPPEAAVGNVVEEEKDQEEDQLHGWLPRGLSIPRQAGIISAASEAQHQHALWLLRRPKRVARRAVAPSEGPSGQESPLACSRQDKSPSRTGANADDSYWRVMLSASMPHNPEALAALLVSGRLINPHTAVPASLLAAAAREQKHERQEETMDRSCGSRDAPYQPPSAPQQQQDRSLAEKGRGPAVALVRCASEHDVAAALALNGRRLFSPSMTRNRADSWRPLRVVVQSWARAAYGGGQMGMPPTMAIPAPFPSSSPRSSRVRDTGPRVCRVVLTGLPGHMDVDDVIALFGNGLLLPGQCPTPHDRRFLLLCPDAVAFSALMEWSGTRLPDKPLDALKQIIPQANSWSTIHIEEDDGIQLSALLSQLMASARVCGATADDSTIMAAFRRHQQYPFVAGRFHPAELDEMDEMAATAPAVEGSSSGNGCNNLTARRSLKEPASEPVTAREDLCGGAVDGVMPSSGDKLRPPVTAAAAPAGPGAGLEPVKPAPSLDRSSEVPTDALILDSVHDAAAAAERAESSRGASSSGLAARPAPRFRRAAHSANSQYATSSSAGGPYFGPGISPGHGGGGAAAAAAVAARCACCPPPSSASRSGGGGGDAGPTSWSGQAAVELLNKLLALGIEPAAGSASQAAQPGDGGVTRETEERMPFFRRNRKRMPVYPPPDDEDEAEEGTGEGVGQEADCGLIPAQTKPAQVEPAETAAVDTGRREGVWSTSMADTVADEIHGLQAQGVTPTG